MKPTSSINDSMTQLQEWLNSDESLPILRSIAKSVIGWAGGETLVYEITGIQKDEPDLELAVVAYVLEVLFDEEQLENCRLQLIDYLNNRDMKGFRAVLVSRIINKCRDERRKEINSPFHYQFRRMSNALSAEQKKGNGIRYTYRNKTGSYYAISTTHKLPLLGQGYLGADDFKGWPHPGFPLEEIKYHNVKIAISRTFWDRSIVEINREYFLPIIDLVRYMDKTYNFSRLMQSECNVPTDENGQSMPCATEQLHSWQSHDGLNTLASQQPEAEQNLLLDALKTAAERLVQSWKPIMRIAFYLHHVRDITLDEVAERVGLNSAQAASYHVYKTESLLKEFFKQWKIAGYEGERPSEEEQKTVLRVLIDFILKNHSECRDEE